MTPQNPGAGVTEMTVSVQTITVDGSRRMSHRFFEQIPSGTFLDDDGALADDAHLWGRVAVADADGHYPILGTRAGELIQMNRRDAVRCNDTLPSPPWPDPRDGGDKAAWEDYWAVMATFRKAADSTLDELYRTLPQLYLGG
jgi:hypothetical protein